MSNSLSDNFIDISMAILDKLNAGGLDTKHIDFEELLTGNIGSLAKPKINISINDGVFAKMTMWKRKCKPNVMLHLILQNMRGEEKRRFGILKLIESIINVIDNQDLGLNLQDNFKAQNFTNVTTDDYAEKGYILYKINFTCSFVYDTPNADYDDIGELKLIMNNFFLQEPTDNGVADLTGQVDLATEIGGDAYSVYTTEPIYSGNAASVYEIEPSIGGRAESTY